jgi:hypothetical protein
MALEHSGKVVDGIGVHINSFPKGGKYSLVSFLRAAHPILKLFYSSHLRKELEKLIGEVLLTHHLTWRKIEQSLIFTIITPVFLGIQNQSELKRQFLYER